MSRPPAACVFDCSGTTTNKNAAQHTYTHQLSNCGSIVSRVFDILCYGQATGSDGDAFNTTHQVFISFQHYDEVNFTLYIPTTPGPTDPPTTAGPAPPIINLT